jgi:nitrate/TMAO reductase-like tetraheme cytochrome c subunit
MKKPIINVDILKILKFAFMFLIVFWFGISKAGQLDFHKDVSMLVPDPDVLQETYLKGNRKEKKRQCSEEVASPLGAECSYCHNDDVTTFTEKGEKAKEDMKAAVAIGVKCDYCHAGKEQFTEKKEIATKMFELSEIMGAECNFCHAGKDVLTHEGKTAKTAMILQEWAENGTKKCLECHVEKKQFELNFHGWEVLNTQRGLLGL